MQLKKGQLPIVLTAIIALIIFTPLFLIRGNYEFLIYIGVMVFLTIVILATNKRVNYPNSVLWALTVWAIIHICGGGIYIGGKKLYEFMIFNIVGDPYNIFRYDQFAHIYGFFAATLAMYYLLKPILKKGLKKWTAVSVVVIMAGLGLGALNEIIEFTATVFLAETGVGGYVNTCLDLVSNLIGAIIAMIFIYFKENK